MGSQAAGQGCASSSGSMSLPARLGSMTTRGKFACSSDAPCSTAPDHSSSTWASHAVSNASRDAILRNPAGNSFPLWGESSNSGNSACATGSVKVNGSFTRAGHPMCQVQLSSQQPLCEDCADSGSALHKPNPSIFQSSAWTHAENTCIASRIRGNSTSFACS
jgi:hypothetical protein